MSCLEKQGGKYQRWRVLTDVPGIEESEEQSDHEDVRELRKGGHCVESRVRDLLCAAVLKR